MSHTIIRWLICVTPTWGNGPPFKMYVPQSADLPPNFYIRSLTSPSFVSPPPPPFVNNDWSAASCLCRIMLHFQAWTTGETELTVIFFERKWGSIAYVYGALILIRFEEGGCLSKAPTGEWYYKQFPSCYPISSIQNKLACSWNVCFLE